MVSSEGQQITLNACAFAAVNSWCYALLKSAPSDSEDFHVVTELTQKELIAFKTFATTGKVIGFQTNKELLSDKVTMESLTLGAGTLGLSIENLKSEFTKVELTLKEGCQGSRINLNKDMQLKSDPETPINLTKGFKHTDEAHGENSDPPKYSLDNVKNEIKVETLSESDVENAEDPMIDHFQSTA